MNINFEQEFIESFGYRHYNYSCQCGKEHYALDDETFIDTYENDYGEMVNGNKIRESLEQESTENDNIIIHYIEELHIICVGNSEFVYECECQGWKPYLNFVESHKYQLRDMLVKMSDKVTRIAEEQKIFDILRNTNL